MLRVNMLTWTVFRNYSYLSIVYYIYQKVYWLKISGNFFTQSKLMIASGKEFYLEFLFWSVYEHLKLYLCNRLKFHPVLGLFILIEEFKWSIFIQFGLLKWFVNQNIRLQLYAMRVKFNPYVNKVLAFTISAWHYAAIGKLFLIYVVSHWMRKNNGGWWRSHGGSQDRRMPHCFSFLTNGFYRHKKMLFASCHHSLWIIATCKTFSFAAEDVYHLCVLFSITCVPINRQIY